MGKRSLLPRQRQEEIHRLLQRQRYASVKELADAIDVSSMTVRRDLDALEAAGMVRRVFGGAQISEPPVSEQVYSERMEQQREAKERIARLACSLVRDGDTIALDGSTTAAYLARSLRNHVVTVVTNSLQAANELAGSAVNVFLSGGMLRHATQDLIGEAAIHSLQSVNVDKVFFSASGLHHVTGFTDSNSEEVALKRALFGIAATRIALVDSSKFGRVSLHELIEPASVDRLLTNAPPSEELERMLNNCGIRLEIADA